MGPVSAGPLRTPEEARPEEAGGPPINWPRAVEGPVAPPARPAAAGPALGAGALLLTCLGLHIAAMWPTYTASLGTAIASSPYEAAAYAGLELGWALAALLVLSRGSVSGGVALGAGLGAVEAGLLFADTAAGFQVSDGSSPGVWFAIAGLGTGLAGVLLGASTLPDLGRPLPAGLAPRQVLAALAAIIAVAFFWPSWDHIHLVSSAGQVRDFTSGNAFSQPPAVMTGEVLAGLAMGAVVILAAFWAPARTGAWATLGAVVALGSQVISGWVQVQEPTTEVLGPGNTRGLDLGATTVSLTAEWAVDAAAAGALLLLALWAALEGRRP
jgi:hypothetical protein